MKETGQAFKSLYDIVVRLRGPGGCPWDREQSPASLRECLIEETYECIEAIDEENTAHIKEELGDLALLVTMLAYMHEEKGVFLVADVFQTICEKLIRRHPHVFGEVQVKDSNEVLDNWAKIKVTQEGRKPKDSILDEVSGGLPPLDRAWKLQKKAAKAGFDWPTLEGVVEKINEELGEVKEAVGASTSSAAGSTAKSNKVEEELGDLLFSVVNLCRYLKVEPSVALRRTNSKFIERFKHMERKMKETGQELKQENLGLMDQYWNEAKNGESFFGERFEISPPFVSPYPTKK
jgi:tetrapyrrole methylase family protein/MazG family protein